MKTKQDKRSEMSAQQRDLSGSIIRLGLDLGYGWTKAVTANQQLSFPSVWGVAREIRYSAEDIAARYPGDLIQDDQGTWFMGEMALSQLRPAEHRMLLGRTVNEETIGHVARIRLMKSALAKLFSEVGNDEVIHLHIATGLPVSHMRGAAELKNTLLGQHLIQSNDRRFVVNVAQVNVMPQPYGGFYSQALTPDGDINAYFTAQRTGILDIGRFTIDVMVDDEMQYIDVKSESSQAGVYLAQESLAMAYERQFNDVPSHRVIENILRSGFFRANGEPVNFQEEREAAIVPLREAVINLLQTKWGTATDLDAIYIAGGGAALIGQDVQALYPHTELIDDPQFANARGYLYYAHSRTDVR